MAKLKSVIPFTLPGTQEQVYRLQAALQYLLDIGFASIFDGDNWRLPFLEERSGLVFGSVTQGLLRAVQLQFNIQANSLPDNATAIRINQKLQADQMLADEPSASPSQRVYGTVRNGLGLPVAGLFVEAFDHDLRERQYLGGSTTDASGNYNIPYAPSTIAGAEGRSADLSLQVSQEKGVYLLRTEIRPNVPAELEWNLSLEAKVNLRQSEFSAMMEAVLPLLPGQGIEIADLEETEERADLSFLQRETGMDIRLLALFVLAHRYRRDLLEVFPQHPLPPALLYAWMRCGLPQEYDLLVAYPEIKKAEALDLAIKENIIEAWYKQPGLQNMLEHVTRNFVPSAHFNDYEMLGVILPNSNDRTKVLQILNDSPTKGANLSMLLDEAGVTPNARRVALLNNEILRFTALNTELVQQLQQVDDGHAERFSDMVMIQTHLLYEAGDWANFIQNSTSGPKRLPPFIVGETEEARIGNYAEFLASSVCYHYPTEVMAQRIGRGDVTASVPANQDLLGQYLRDAAKNKQFHLGKTDLAAFFQRAEVFEGYTVEQQTALRHELVRLRQVFQMTPDDAKAAALLQQGFDSVKRVVTLPEAVFVQQTSEVLGGPAMAQAVYRKATGIQATELYWQLSLKSARLTPPIHALMAGSGTNAMASVPEGYDHILEALGNFDYCECKHCESITSPAAYLTDLFEYLPTEARDELFRRRPDLPHLSLTCDNSNTPLPYIDLVNEVLEYYVVHRVLDKDLPNANGDYPEKSIMLSQPQRVLQEAYSRLQEAVYPLGLPFQRDLALLRAFAKAVKVSLSELMEPGHGSEAPGDAALLASIGSSLEEKQGVYDRISEESALRLFYGVSDLAELAHLPLFLEKTGFSMQDLVDLLKTTFISPRQTDNEALVLALTEEDEPCNTGNYELRHLDGTALTVEDWGRLYFAARLKNLTKWKIEALGTLLQHKAASEGYGDFLLKTAWYYFLASELGWKVQDFVRELHFGSRELLLQNALNITETERLKLQQFTGNDLHDFKGFYAIIRAVKILKAERLNIPQMDYLLVDERNENGKDATKTAHLHDVVSTLFKEISEANLMYLIAEVPDKQQGLEILELLHSAEDAKFLTDLAANSLSFSIDLSPSETAPGSDKWNEVNVLLTRLGKKAILKTLDGNTKLILNGFLVENEPTDISFLENAFQYAEQLSRAQDRAERLLQHVVPSKSGIFVREYFIRPNERHLKIMLEWVRPLLLRREKLKRATVFLNERLDISLAQLQTLIIDRQSLLRSVYLTDASGVEEFILTLASSDTQLTSDEAGPISPGHFYFEAPASGNYSLLLAEPAPNDYTIYVDGQRLDLMVTMNKFGQFFNWQAGQLVHVVQAETEPLPLMIQLGEAPARRIEETDKLPAYQVNSIMHQWLRLERAAFFIKHHDLLPDDLRATPDLSSFWQLLPGRKTPHGLVYGPELFKIWLKVAEYVQLRNAWTEGRESLRAVLHSMPNSISETLRQWAAWQPEPWASLMVNFDWTDPTTRLTQVAKLRSIIALAEKTGLAAETLAAGGMLDETALNNALARQYNGKTLQDRKKSMYDELRELQRDALVAYLLGMPDKPTDWKTPDDLYRHFLMDVEMAACMQTSRLRMAMSSVQMFIQRCLLNLEPGVSLDEEAAQWPWRKNYRVWEANRKVLLYPENWLEPEFRTDKSELFEQLENELLQGDLDEELAETALMNYLDGLNAVAKLEICGLHIENKDTDEEVLHVIGRTASMPRTHYYRKRQNGTWSFWEKIDCAIEGEHVMPVIWGGSLFVFWLTFVEQTAGTTVSTIEILPTWTEKRFGKWQPRKEGQVETLVSIEVKNDSFNTYRENIHGIVYADLATLRIDLYTTNFSDKVHLTGWYRLVSRVSPIESSTLMDVRFPIIQSFEGAKWSYNLVHITGSSGKLKGSTASEEMVVHFPEDAELNDAKLCLDSRFLTLRPGRNLFFYQNSRRCVLVEVDTVAKDNRGTNRPRIERQEQLREPVFDLIGPRALDTRITQVRFGDQILASPIRDFGALRR